MPATRHIVLTALAGGVVLGTLGGLASETTIMPTPEPVWRQIARQTATPAAYQPLQPEVYTGPHTYSGPPGREDLRFAQIAYVSPQYEPLNLADYQVEAPVPLPVRDEAGAASSTAVDDAFRSWPAAAEAGLNEPPADTGPADPEQAAAAADDAARDAQDALGG